MIAGSSQVASVSLWTQPWLAHRGSPAEAFLVSLFLGVQIHSDPHFLMLVYIYIYKSMRAHRRYVLLYPRFTNHC